MRKILIVDDNAQNLYLLEVIFKSNDFEVLKAFNGTEALEAAEKKLPDVVVSDILMPVMDGYSLCRKWKTDERLKDIPFIFYTATYTDPKDQDLALSLGADCFIIKPQEPEEILRCVMEVLASRKKEYGHPFTEIKEENVYYKQYNAVLIRKLEDKMEELEENNKHLKTEISEREKTERELQRMIAEKEALIRELFHRTRNNMQVIVAMMDLQLNYSAEDKVKGIFQEMKSRIQSMALLQQMLYESKDLSVINLKEYIIQLVRQLSRNFNVSDGKIKMDLSAVEEADVLIDSAVPCGLLLNELITNSFKYAFPGGKKGEVKISLHQDPDRLITLTVSDNGAGVAADFDFQEGSSMGLKTIFLLGEGQLGGKVLFEKNDGVSCTLRFKDTLYDKRV